MLKARSLILTMILFAGCSRRDAGPSRSFDSALVSALPICEEFFLPNSMARPPGFDINSHQSELEHRLMELSTAFGSASGLSYLEERAAREGDDVAKACIAKLIVYARSSV